jgi:predicted DNA binding protein
MRRLILEVSEKELLKAGIELSPLKKVEKLELLYFLRQDNEGFDAISRVEFRDSNSKPEDLLTGGLLIEAQTIEREKNGAYILFIRSVSPSLSSILNYIGVDGGYLHTPLGIANGKVRFSFLGSEKQIKDFMEKIDAKAIRYRVILLADANFSPISPLSRLTAKQQEVLLTAYEYGYYSIPRKITSEDLAKKLGLVDSTVAEHLRKAEQRLIREIVENKIQ